MSDVSVYGADEWVSRIVNSTSQMPPSRLTKLFIAGDKSQVGKSSCCLGIVSALLNAGFKPNEIAYIKPVTQCEEPQLISEFCASQGITAVGVGPVVFYAGFTREFLKGNTKGTEALLNDVVAGVNSLVTPERRIIIVDGVGFPAVGSIVGLSNAEVAKALDAAVLLVCPSGVGNAIDSFNLNEAYFTHNGCTVIGALFNRVKLTGYYNLANCKAAITSYFNQFRKNMSVYGFITENENNTKMSDFIQSEFNTRFDIAQLVSDVNGISYKSKRKLSVASSMSLERASKRTKTREEIAKEAKQQGGTGG